MLFAWLLANSELVIKVFEAKEVAFQIILGKNETQFADDADV